MTWPVIVLAAGASSRMDGADKLLQIVDGRPLLRRQVELALGVSDQVFVALPPRPHPRYEAIDDLGITRIEVTDATEGMNASLRAAFAAMPAGTEAAMLLLGDLPDLMLEDIKTVLQAVDLKSDTLIWRGATDQGRAGHPVVFHHTLFDAFADLSGDTGGREVVSAAGPRVVLVPLPGDRARRDLDTPEDWAEWRRQNPERG